MPENDLCLRKESLVTQLKGNVTLVIASPNVNHPCGVARTESKDGVICGIEVSSPLCHSLPFCALSSYPVLTFFLLDFEGMVV